MNNDRELRKTFRAKNDLELTGVGLIRRSQPLADAFRGRLPLLRELADINEHFGVEIAQTVFKLAVEAIPSYGAFIRRVRAFDLRMFTARPMGASSKNEPPFEVTIVASALPLKGRSASATRQKFETWADWARSMGFTTDIIETSPLAGLRENAQTISNHLISNPHPRRILVTYGSGATEFRTLLAARMGLRGVVKASATSLTESDDAGELASIKAWINIEGAYNGASVARLKNLSRWERFRLEISKFIGGTNLGQRAQAWRQLDPRLPVWRTAPIFPRGLQVINVIGFPLRSEMPASLMVSHERLSREIGPNDGAVGLFEAIAHPGFILPVEGLTHSASDGKLEPVFKRVLAVVAGEAELSAETSEIRKESDDSGFELELDL